MNATSRSVTQITPARPVSADTSGSGLDLATATRVIFHRKWVVIAAALGAMFLGAIYAFVIAEPVYRAQATVMLDIREPQVVDLDSVMTSLSGDTSEVNTQVEILRSRALMERVVRKLELTADPEFNPELIEKGLLKRAVLGIKGLLGMLPPEVTDAAEIEERSVTQTVETLADAVSVRNIPLSLVFSIQVASHDPKKATLVANTLADEYIADQIQAKFDATEEATVWLTQRVAELGKELEKAESAAKSFSTSIQLISPEALEAQSRQLKDLRDRIGDAEESALATQARADAMTAATDRAAQATAAGEDQLSALLAESVADPAGDAALRFDQRFAQLLARMQDQARRSASQVVALKASQEELNTRIAQQSDDLVMLEQLVREAEASKLIYEYFLGRLKETAVQQGIQQADSRVLSTAAVPLLASEPRRSLILLLSGILGLLLGSVGVVAAELRKTSFHSAADLTDVTGHAVLGQIPRARTKKREAILNYITENPTSAMVEAVRNLRTSILLSNIDRPPQVIMLTSSLPGEGKTTVSLALTQNLAGLGKKVLLIEGDIRKLVFAEYFDIKDSRGLLSVISGDVTFEDAIHRDPRMGADILLGEKSAVNAADIFSSDRFRYLLEELRHRYDIILIDTPPVLVVPDARVIGTMVDAIVYVVLWDKTLRSQVKQGLSLFDMVNARVTGLVLSQIDAKRGRRYGAEGSGGYYGDSAKGYYDT